MSGIPTDQQEELVSNTDEQAESNVLQTDNTIEVVTAASTSETTYATHEENTRATHEENTDVTHEKNNDVSNKQIIKRIYENDEIETCDHPKRLRRDDSDANSDTHELYAHVSPLETQLHGKIIASHYNEQKDIRNMEREKSRIAYMRNFNNWIKTQLINEYLGFVKKQKRVGDPLNVLDMCCGKGGDLLKWEKNNITYLICTDIAEVSIERCKQRYDEMKKRLMRSKFHNFFKAEFFACDSTLVRLRGRYKDPSIKLDLVSCQFAFHYSFESLSQADCMVRNASECLQPGGYFIATMPDAYEIMKRLRNSTNGKSFGNDIYNIEFLSDTNPPSLFGAKYKFHLIEVVDCPEFLVHFPTLVKLCKKHGLKFVRKTTFADYFNESYELGREFFKRIDAFETVYASHCKNNEQYEHINNYSGPRDRPLGTLSKSEWEAATIYLVCAFQKCKSTLDADGKPVFEDD